MSIVIEVKDIVERNNKLLELIHGTFDSVLNDVSDGGVRVKANESEIGVSLGAMIDRYRVSISIGEILRELKNPAGKLPDNVPE